MDVLRRPMRGLRLVLVLSLGLNLFGLAFIGEEAWRHREQQTAALETDDAGEALSLRTVIRQIMDKLPPEDATLLREAFIARLPELVVLRRQSAQAIGQVRADIAQHPFDADKTRTDMLAAREARAKMASIIQETLLDVLPRMSEAARRALAEYRLLPARN